MNNPITYQFIGALALAAANNPDETTAISDLLAILFYVARVLILAVGGGIGIIKMVKGKSDENPRDFYEGIIVVAAAGVLFAATFGVQAIFK